MTLEEHFNRWQIDNQITITGNNYERYAMLFAEYYAEHQNEDLHEIHITLQDINAELAKENQQLKEAIRELIDAIISYEVEYSKHDEMGTAINIKIKTMTITAKEWYAKLINKKVEEFDDHDRYITMIAEKFANKITQQIIKERDEYHDALLEKRRPKTKHFIHPDLTDEVDD